MLTFQIEGTDFEVSNGKVRMLRFEMERYGC